MNSIKLQHAKYKLAMQQKLEGKRKTKPSPASYFNCINPPINIMPESGLGAGDSPILVGFPPDPLHCFLLGPPNNLFKKLEDIVECVEGLKSFKEKHHLKMTEGNSFLLLFENIFGNILQKINF